MGSAVRGDGSGCSECASYLVIEISVLEGSQVGSEGPTRSEMEMAGGSGPSGRLGGQVAQDLLSALRLPQGPAARISVFAALPPKSLQYCPLREKLSLGTLGI
jgi:hypothetical protein